MDRLENIISGWVDRKILFDGGWIGKCYFRVGRQENVISGWVDRKTAEMDLSDVKFLKDQKVKKIIYCVWFEGKKNTKSINGKDWRVEDAAARIRRSRKGRMNIKNLFYRKSS